MPLTVQVTFDPEIRPQVEANRSRVLEACCALMHVIPTCPNGCCAVTHCCAGHPSTMIRCLEVVGTSA